MEIWSVGGTYDTGSKEFLNVYGNVWYDGKNHSINFPKQFVEISSVLANSIFPGGIGQVSIEKKHVNYFSFFIYHTREYTFKTTILVDWIAIGKWK